MINLFILIIIFISLKFLCKNKTCDKYIIVLTLISYLIYISYLSHTNNVEQFDSIYNPLIISSAIDRAKTGCDANETLAVTSDGTKLYETGRTGPGFTVAQTGLANMAGGVQSVGFRKLTVTTPICYTTSKVFLTLSGQNTVGVYSAEAISNNSFQIVSNNSNDQSTVYWQIVN